MLYHHAVYYVLFLAVVIIKSEEEFQTNIRFSKSHLKTDLLDPYNCSRGGFIESSRFIQSSNVTIADLYVSSTRYSNNEHIEVSWLPSTAPCNDDFIGVYFTEIPLDTDVCAYFDFEFVQTGQSNMSWLMINLRRQLDFRYYSRDNQCTGHYILIARSPIVEPVNYNEPVHIHMAYGDRTDQMFMSFSTNSNQSTPQCQYGLDPSSLKLQTNGTTITYTASDMCEGKANIPGPQGFIDPGYMHTILLSDLLPSTTYYYRVGSNEHGWSSVLTFTNRPLSNDENATFIVYGDMGLVMKRESGARATLNRIIERIMSDHITCVLHLGDLSYAIGIGALWDAYMSQMEPITSRVPCMIVVGNHEYDHITGGDKDPSGAPGPGGFQPTWSKYGNDSGGECAVPVVYRFHSPSNGNGLFWYSFDVGSMHIAIFSTEHDFTRMSPQYAWFEQDLRSVNRSRTPWLIVGSHRPMYTSRDHAEIIKVVLQLHLEPLMYKYHVDVNLFAHVHAYERTCPMYQQRCVDDGITHVLLGTGGRSLSNDSYSGAEWSIFHDITYGYSKLWANRTHLDFNYYHTDNNTLADHFQLKK